MNRTISLPQGVKDFGPERAERLRRVEDGLLEEFAKWGYKRVITPLFEYLDTMTAGLGEELKSKLMKFVDPSTGEVVVLRPDITPQIGRIVATQLDLDSYHLRLCYSGRIVRSEEKSSGKEREIFQAGCELVGPKSLEYDAEVIALSIKSLKKLGLRDMVLDIGHSGILEVVFSSLGDLREEFERALRKRKLERIESILKKSKFDKKTQHLILDFCSLSGSKTTLKRLKEDRTFRKYVTELEKVLEIIDEYQINCDTLIDIGDIKGFNYYTGVTFQIISSNQIHNPLVMGGRYDNLVQKYGRSTPATGFAIDIEQVISSTKIHLEDSQVHFIVIPKTTRLRGKAIRITQWLRSSGFKVILDCSNGGTTSHRSDQKALTSYGKIIVETSKKLELIESRSGVKKQFANLDMLFKGEL